MSPSSSVVTPRQVFVALAVTTLVAGVAVQLLGRHPIPMHAATAALFAQSLISALLARSYHRPEGAVVARLAGMGALALLVGPVAWFFGPNAGLCGFLALALLVTGVLSGWGRAPFPSAAAWVIYVGIATAEAVVVGAIVARKLPDLSVTPVLVGHHPDWHHVAAQACLQGIFVAALLAGRGLARRYASLATALDEASRSWGAYEALVAEARAEYAKALAVAQQGVLSARELGEYWIGGLRYREGATELYDAVDDQGTKLSVRIEAVGAELEVTAGGGTEGAADLREWVVERGAMGHDELRELTEGLCAAVAELHSRGLAHLAIDPAHVHRSEGSWSLASGGASAAGYLAPEQLRGAADARADIFAATAVLAFAVRGDDPFSDAAAVFGERPELPSHLAPVLLRGLAKDPDERFASAAELRDAMLAALGGEERPPRAAPPTTQPPSARVDIDVRDDAYRTKMPAYTVGVTLVCAVGMALLLVVAREPVPLRIAIVAMVGIVAAAWWHYLAVIRRGRMGYWPWVVAAGLSVGPAYSIGLHSGVAAAIVLWLFSGGTLRGGTHREKRSRALAAVLVTHSAVFAAVVAGWLPDAGTVPIIQPDAPRWEPVLLHALLMGTYALAYVAGHLFDLRHEALARRADEVAREAARKEVELSAARNELDLVLASAAGIFAGTSVGGFEVGALLGRGGMGEVYEAYDRENQQPIALKLLRGDHLLKERALDLFRSEAAAMERVDSPYVARLLAFGDGSDGLPFLAMELVEGRSLAEILRQRGTLDREDARRMIRELATGLADVHAADVVHCDVKPANVLLTDEGRWKLVDFGISRATSGDDDQILAGTPAYMSPEQCQLRGSVDARADLYALSLVIYRALVGRPGLTCRGPQEVVALAAVGPPDPRPSVSEDVALALRIGFAADPADRFQTAAELAEAFEAAFEGALPDALRSRARGMSWGDAPTPA